jgi:hypothetical protein
LLDAVENNLPKWPRRIENIVSSTARVDLEKDPVPPAKLFAILTQPRRANQQNAVQSLLQKDSCFHLAQIIGLFLAVPSHRGADRDRHERGAGCGGREGAIDEQR